MKNCQPMTWPCRQWYIVKSWIKTLTALRHFIFGLGSPQSFTPIALGFIGKDFIWNLQWHWCTIAVKRFEWKKRREKLEGLIRRKRGLHQRIFSFFIKIKRWQISHFLGCKQSFSTGATQKIEPGVEFHRKFELPFSEFSFVTVFFLL